MKKSKLAASALLGLAFAASASAQTKINISGSNGDRVITQTAIPKLLTNAVYTGTDVDPTKSNFGIWTGKFNGQSVKIKVAFIGATGGIAAVAGSQTVKFSADSTPTVDPSIVGNQSDPQIPHFTLSTNFQATTVFNGTVGGITYEKLTDQLVGVVPMKWLASKNFPGKNLTTQQAQLLYRNGKAPLALFTGLTTDKSKSVFALGRNSDAGQRYGALTESGLGANTVVKHYQPVITGAVPGTGTATGVNVGGTVDSQSLWPIETVSGISSRFLGNGGVNSGKNLAPLLTAVLGPNAYKVGNPKATAGYYISYLTTADANNIAIPNGAVELSWNGVKYSESRLRNGQYTFWLYTHVMYKPSLSGVPRTFADALANQIKTVDATAQGAGLFVNSLSVTRTTEGGVVLPKYF